MKRAHIDTQIDTQIKVETPEGIDLSLEVAGPLVRGVALGIDTVIKLVIQLLCYFVLSFLGSVGSGIIMLVLFLLEWFYPVLFEIYWNGQTPGKNSMGIHVVHEDGAPISWGGAMLRNLIRFVDFLPIGYLTGLIAMVTSKRFQRLGDLVAGTVVVYSRVDNTLLRQPARFSQRSKDKQSVGSQSIDQRFKDEKLKDKPSMYREKMPREKMHREQEATSATLMPPIALTPEEQVAIIAFGDRLHTFSKARAAEIAMQLEPLFRTSEEGDSRDRGEQTVDALQRVANGLRGGHS